MHLTKVFVIKMQKWKILCKMKILKRILICTLSLCLIGITSTFLYYKITTKDVSLCPEKLILQENNLSIYDCDKKLINVNALSRRPTVTPDEIPRHTKQAFIDVEDKRFYSHGGFDYKGIVRAMLHNAKSRSFKEGASTISQQLIKNSHLSQEKTLKRKLKEWKLTRQLEEKYTKEEILTTYLNTIYFGHSCFGIASAADFYFGKQTQELTLAESAMLAGMIKSPNNYSPFRHPENCQKRRACVLNVMQKNGSITQAEKQEALSVPLPTQTKQSSAAKDYVHFVFDELAHFTDARRITMSGNIEIYTYLDEPLQKHVEALNAQETECNKAFLVLDAKTGGFKACVSEVGNARRLPGSILKPLLVYTPAIEENFLSPATPILDEKVNYSGYAPQNYDGTFHGYVSARECVEKSLNVPAVKVLSSVGISKCCAYLEKLGLKVEEKDKNLALALGGMQHGFSLTELLSAYSVFPNNGNKQDCGFIDEIKINGKSVYKKEKNAVRVFSEDSAYLMTDMLKSTVKNGTAKKMRDLPFDVAAKTGTVGTKRGNTDAYTVSYTAKDCVAVWLGKANNSTITHTGGGLPCNYSKEIHEYLRKAYAEQGEEIPPFEKPQGVVNVALDKPSYYDTHSMLLADDNAPAEFRFNELFKKGATPLNKSTCFTFPTIPTPTLKLENNQVVICFSEHFPKYYTYKIDRYDYATHTTVYTGAWLPAFTDDTLKRDKKYVYTVTPLFQGKAGKSVTLPIVSTSGKSSTILEDKKILDTDWWSK